MPDIQLYDATLRDGMGGGGLTLTAEEKLRVVHALDALGVHLIEAGFPASNPKEQELFELLAGERLSVAEIVAFGMTRRREIGGRGRRGAARPRGVLRAGVHARRQGLGAARREGRARLARGEPGDDRRLGRVPRGRGQARAVRRRALLRRLRARPRLRAGLPARGRRGGRRAARAVRHQRRLAAAADPDGVRGRRRSAAGRPARHPHARRLRLRGREHADGGRSGRDARCRGRSTASASAPATPTSSRSSPTCS